jgi:hemoglobin/transferrin/lactoferrin receptor protein
VSTSGSSVLAGRLALLSGGIALGVIVATGTAFAQQADRLDVPEEGQGEVAASSGGSTLLDRVVIGAGVEKVAIDTPQAVTVLDQEAIEAEQPMTIGEIFRQVPGVTIVGSDRVAGQSFNIRGIGDLGSADESKIIVSVDGAVKFYEQYRMGSFFSDPELYKRVEVLRGPASSTLYGSGAIGGVVNFTTKDASDLLQDGQTGAVRLKTMYDSNKAGALASLTAAYAFSEQTEVLLNGNFRRANNYEAGGGQEISGSAFKSFSGLAKVTHRFGVNNEQVLRLSYERWQSNDNDTDYSQTGTFVFGTIDRDITDQTAVLSYENPASDNPWLDFKVNLSVSDTQVWQGNASAPIPSPLFADSDYGYRTYAARVENTFEWIGDSYVNHLTVGAQGSYQERTATTTLGPASFHPEGTDTKFGVFLQNEFTWNDRLTIIPGARIDFVTLEPGNGVTGANTRHETAFSPKLAAMYKLNETFSLFGSVAHTERVPTLDELYSSNAPNGDYPGGRTVSLGLQKETSNAVEAGFAISGYDLVRDGDSLQLKTTAFFNDLRDMIVPNPNMGQATPVTYYQNVTHAQIYGVEVEAAYDADYAFANLAYSHVHGEDKATGATLNTIPADTLAMTIGAKIPKYDLAIGWRGLFAGSISTGATTGPFAGYAVHDLFADWKPDEGTLAGLEFRASVENLFDKRYQNNLAGDDGKGRTFKLTLAKTLGW